MVDKTAKLETAVDRNKWRGLIEAAKGLNKRPIKQKKNKELTFFFDGGEKIPYVFYD